MANYRRGRGLRPRVNINIRYLNVNTMSGSASFNVGDFAVIDPISSQNVTNYKTQSTQRGGAGAFNSGNNNNLNNPFNRIRNIGNDGNANT